MELTLKEIDECKQALDKHYAFNETRLDTIEKEVRLEAKTTKRDALEADRTESTNEYLAVLNSYGFNSAVEFYKYYGDKCLESYKECNPVSGFCDWCGLKEWGKQKCAELYSVKGCGYKKPTTCPDSALKWAMQQDALGLVEEVDGIKWHNGCPKGHGYYIEVKLCKSMPKELDIKWRTKEWLR